MTQITQNDIDKWNKTTENTISLTKNLNYFQISIEDLKL